MTQQTTQERMAELAHDVWTRWMAYMFSKCVNQTDGGVVIPADLVQRWGRQARTLYPHLPESEKQSDRAIAQEYMAAMEPPWINQSERPETLIETCQRQATEIDAKDKRIAELERLFALNPIKVGDISITLGVNETGEWRMTFDGTDDAKLAVVAGMFSTAMQAVMGSAKEVPNA